MPSNFNRRRTQHQSAACERSRAPYNFEDIRKTIAAVKYVVVSIERWLQYLQANWQCLVTHCPGLVIIIIQREIDMNEKIGSMSTTKYWEDMVLNQCAEMDTVQLSTLRLGINAAIPAAILSAEDMLISKDKAGHAFWFLCAARITRPQEIITDIGAIRTPRLFFFMIFSLMMYTSTQSHLFEDDLCHEYGCFFCIIKV